MANPRGYAFSCGGYRRFRGLMAWNVYIQTQDKTLVFCLGHARDSFIAIDCGGNIVFGAERIDIFLICFVN